MEGAASLANLQDPGAGGRGEEAWGGRGVAVLGAGGGQSLDSVPEARGVGRGRGQKLPSSWCEVPPSFCGHTDLNCALCYVLHGVDLHFHVSCFK